MGDRAVVRRLRALIVASLAALLGVLLGASAAAAAPTLQMPAYAHDRQHPPGAFADTAPERGPPTADVPLTTYHAVGRCSNGDSARSGRTATQTDYTYNDPAEGVPVVDAPVTTSEVTPGTQRTRPLATRVQDAAESPKPLIVGANMTRVEAYADSVGCGSRGGTHRGR